jgi:uncharacterized protein (DUF2345 family)
VTPLSIEAHADALQVLADKSVTLASAGERQNGAKTQPYSMSSTATAIS